MKKTILIVIIILVIIAIAVGAFFFWQKGSSPTTPVTTTSPLNPPGQGSPTSTGTTTGGIPSGSLLLDDAAITSADLTTTMPADAPQGPTLSFQVATGTLILNNFYNIAQGYWPDGDMVLIQETSSYAIWYYRTSSQFEIDLPLGATVSDEDAAAAVLQSDLGIDQPTLCQLSVTVVFDIDRGISSESGPLDSCPQPGQ